MKWGKFEHNGCINFIKTENTWMLQKLECFVYWFSNLIGGGEVGELFFFFSLNKLENHHLTISNNLTCKSIKHQSLLTLQRERQLVIKCFL